MSEQYENKCTLMTLSSFAAEQLMEEQDPGNLVLEFGYRQPDQ